MDDLALDSALLRSSRDIIVILDADLNCVRSNNHFNKATGLTESEIVGRHILSMFNDDSSKDVVMRGCEMARAGSDASFLQWVELPTQGYRLLELLIVPASTSAGSPCIVVQARDFTDWRFLQTRLQQVLHCFAVIRNLNQRIQEFHSEEDLLQGACDELVGLHVCDEASITFPDEDGVQWRNVGFATSSSQELHNKTASDGRYYPDVHARLQLKFSEGGWGQLDVGWSGAFYPESLDGELFEHVASEISRSVDAFRANRHLKHDELEIRQMLFETVRSIAHTMEESDPYTAGHMQRVADLSVQMAKTMRLPAQDCDGLDLAASIHDIGKVRVPMEILNKPGRLSSAELDLIKVHPESGYGIVKDINFPWPIATIIHQHHERMDGSGYPQGLSGSEILPESQIVAVADVVEAMSGHRPYRAGLGIEAAFAELDKNERVYGAEAVAACKQVFKSGFEF